MYNMFIDKSNKQPFLNMCMSSITTVRLTQHSQYVNKGEKQKDIHGTKKATSETQKTS